MNSEVTPKLNFLKTFVFFPNSSSKLFNNNSISFEIISTSKFPIDLFPHFYLVLRKTLCFDNYNLHCSATLRKKLKMQTQATKLLNKKQQCVFQNYKLKTPGF